ncbi:MAG: hypothetical protein M1812_006777 [Candelaria pacifica]|nr:MAG: hypothetical protein M1812_006777 [Candelaria pacifica]
MRLQRSLTESLPQRHRKSSPFTFSTIFLSFLLLLFLASRTQATELCEKCPDPKRFNYPGIGFDLTLDYGTSVLYHPNKTSSIIAQISGGPSYKTQMLHFTQPAAQIKFSNNPTQPSLSTESHHHISQTSYLNPTLKFLSSIKTAIIHHLNHYLPQTRPPTPPINPTPIPLTKMLQSLKAATEAYLSQPLHTIGLSTPNFWHPTHHEILTLALQNADLKLATHRTITAAISASWSHRSIRYPPINNKEYPAQEKNEQSILLVIDYSNSALTLTILLEEDGVFETLKIIHRVDLGMDILKAGNCEDECRNEYWREVRNTFTDMKDGLGIHDGWGSWGGRGDDGPKIVLVGEHAHDKAFIDLIRDESIIAGSGEEELALERSDARHPVFAAALGVAMIAKAESDYPPCLISGWCNDPSRLGREL